MTGVKVSEYSVAASLTGSEKIPLGTGVKKATTPDQLREYINQPSQTVADKLIVIGDSLSNGYLAGGLLYGWPNVMCQLLNWQLVNNAAVNYSGYVPTTTDPFIGRISSTIPLDYDGHVILHGGINDCLFANGVLGLLGTDNESTLYGAIDAAIRAVLARSPKLLLWVMVPHIGASNEATKNSDGWAFPQGRAAQRHVAHRLQKTFGNRLRIIDAERDFTPLLNRDYAENTVDQLHPSPVGHSIFARYVGSVLSGADLITQRNAVYSVDFTQLAAGDLQGKDGWSVESGSYVLSGAGLTVDAVFSSHANGATRATPALARSVRALVDGQIVLHWRRQSSAGFSIWTVGSGATVTAWNFGKIDGATVTICPPNPQGSLSDGNYWIELEQDGGFLNARVWAEGGARPVQPLATQKITPTEAVAYPLLGSVGLVGTSSTPAVVKQLIIYE